MSSMVDEHGRPEPPFVADEEATLLGFLEYQRATLKWKTSGLDADALQVTVGASSMTLGGMLKHLAFVESYWFVYRLFGRNPGKPWNEVDWESDPDWDWHSAVDDTPDQLRQFWQETVAQSNAMVAEALTDGGLDYRASHGDPDDDDPSLRWIVVHMIEEYARHNGHADLIRESIDGETGE